MSNSYRTREKVDLLMYFQPSSALNVRSSVINKYHVVIAYVLAFHELVLPIICLFKHHHFLPPPLLPKLCNCKKRKRIQEGLYAIVALNEKCFVIKSILAQHANDYKFVVTSAKEYIINVKKALFHHAISISTK